MAAALGDQREGHRLQRFDLAHHAVAAAPAPGAARPATQGVLHQAQGKFALERLDRRVQGVAHRHVHRAGPVGVRARPLAAADRLVVGEARAAEREVVHRPLPQGTAEGSEHQVGHARRGLHVARRDRRAGAGVEHAALGDTDVDGAVGAGGGRDVGVGQHAHRKEAGRARHRGRAVEVPLVLGGAAGEVQQQPLAVDHRP